jgi:hypothetical protein
VIAPGPAAATFRLDGSYADINRHYQEHGWTDGLPIVPPTEDEVGEFLRWADRHPQDVVAVLPPRQGEATVERVAINAVMAGCRPEYLPVIITAIEALADPGFNLDSIQATTHPVAPLIIVNGPIARELGINAGYNAFGQGFRANMTIGRAVRLILMNVGGGLPGTGDRSTQGSPAKIAYCVAENEAASPWEPLHVEAGFPADVSTVTVLGCEGPHNIQDHHSNTGVGVLRNVVGAMGQAGSNNLLSRHHRPRRVRQAASEGIRLRPRSLPAGIPRRRVPPVPGRGTQGSRRSRHTPANRRVARRHHRDRRGRGRQALVLAADLRRPDAAGSPADRPARRHSHPPGV